MKKLSLIFAIVVLTTLSYGQNVKVGNLSYKQTEHVVDSVSTYTDTNLGGGCELVIHRKDTSLFSTSDVIEVSESGQTTQFIVDSVDNDKPTPAIYATNKVTNKHFILHVFKPCGENPNEFVFIVRNDDDTESFYYKGIYK